MPWTALEMSARKFGMTATISVRMALVSTKQTQPDWLPSEEPGTVLARGREVLLVESTAQFEGRAFDEKTWIDPTSNAAIQIVDTETGVKNHRKVYRLLTSGFVLERREPAGATETTLPPQLWSLVSRTRSTYSPAPPAGSVVTGALGLVCTVPADRLSAPGDRATFYVLVRDQLEEVVLAVDRVEPFQAEFVEEGASSRTQVKAPLDAVAITVASRPLDASTGTMFRVFGLERSIRVVFEPTRRLPLQITGQLGMIGQFTINLERVATRPPGAPPTARENNSHLGK